MVKAVRRKQHEGDSTKTKECDAHNTRKHNVTHNTGLEKEKVIFTAITRGPSTIYDSSSMGSINSKHVKAVGEQIRLVWEKKGGMGGCDGQAKEMVGESENMEERMAGIQEMKCGKVEEQWVEDLWGLRNFGYAQVEAKGKSGGLLLVWDTKIFSASQSVGDERFIVVKVDVELKDTIVVVVPKFLGEGYHMKTIRVEYKWRPLRCLSCKVFGHVLGECPKQPVSVVLKNLKAPRQIVRGVSVGLNVGFKQTKYVYRHVSQKNS
ncbi:hypothetical protein Tco_0741021 [Tanacetum coccineum]